MWQTRVALCSTPAAYEKVCGRKRKLKKVKEAKKLKGIKLKEKEGKEKRKTPKMWNRRDPKDLIELDYQENGK